MKQVESLNLNFTLVNDRVFKFIKSTSRSRSSDKNRFANLKSISLKGCLSVSNQGLLNLCETTGFHDSFNLECAFDLPHLIDFKLVKVISNSPYFQNVLQLDLSKYPYNDIDEIVSQLVLKGRDTYLRIKSLLLDSTRITDIGLQFISVSKNLKQLKRISIEGCPLIFDKGISYLLESTNLKSLDI